MSGVVFCLVIGLILQSQPVYVEGIDDPAKGANQCYGAAGIYVGCIVASIAVLLYDKITPDIPMAPTLTYNDTVLGDRQQRIDSNRLPLSQQRQSIELSPQGNMI